MIIFNEFTRENVNKHNPNWPQTRDYSYRILIIGSSESEKKALLNLIKQQDDYDYSFIDKFYLCVKDSNEA